MVRGISSTRADLIVCYLTVICQFLLLLLLLRVNRKVAVLAPDYWIIIPAILAATLTRLTVSPDYSASVRLGQLLAGLSAFYLLLHYPLIPIVGDPGKSHAWQYAGLWLAWSGAIASGALCFRFPSLSVIPTSFLLWANLVAPHVSGLPVTTDIDVAPLSEVGIAIAIGLCLSRLDFSGIQDFGQRMLSQHAAFSQPVGKHLRPTFSGLLLMVVVGIHMANYFRAFIAKVGLPGPPLAWLTDNNPMNIFLVALDNGHVLFGGYPQLVAFAVGFLDRTHVLGNFLVLAAQGAAIVSLFFPRRYLVALLVIFDIMHFSIVLVVGANFWPWIILNLIIAYIVVRYPIDRQPLFSKIVATLFIAVAPKFVAVAYLGWYDSSANNKLYFEAEDVAGARYYVPTNFFTYYSYPIGHMDYGSPNVAGAFVTEAPNGGTHDYDVLQAGLRCDVARLQAGGPKTPFVSDQVVPFVRAYHALVLTIEKTFGGFPYDLYPHHFYASRKAAEAFRSLDKTKIVAYIYKQESVCVSFSEGAPRRRVVATGEYRIDVSRIPE